jgi:hypothetical protein
MIKGDDMMQNSYSHLKNIETLRQNFSDAYYRRSRELIFAEMQIQGSNAILDMTEDLSVDPDFELDTSNPLIQNISSLNIHIRDAEGQIIETTTIGNLVTKIRKGLISEELRPDYDRVIDHLQANCLVDLQNGTRTFICVDAINSFVDNVVNNVVNGMGNSIKDMIEAAFDRHISSLEYQRIIADTDEESQLYNELKTLIEMDKSTIGSVAINLDQETIRKNPAETINTIRELCPLATREVIVVNTDCDVSPVGIYNYDSPLSLLCTAVASSVASAFDAIIDFGESIAAMITNFNISAVLDVLEGIWNVAKEVVVSTINQVQESFEALTGNTFVALRESNATPRLAPFSVEQGIFVVGALSQAGKAVMPTTSNPNEIGFDPFHDDEYEYPTFEFYKFYKDGTEFMYELNHSCIFYKIIKPISSFNDRTLFDDPEAEWYEVSYKIVPKLGTNALLFMYPETESIYMDGWYASPSYWEDEQQMDASFKTADNMIPLSSPFYRAIFGEYNSTDDFNDPAGMYEVFHKAIINSVFELLGCVPRKQTDSFDGVTAIRDQVTLRNFAYPAALEPGNFLKDEPLPEELYIAMWYDPAEQHSTDRTHEWVTASDPLQFRKKIKQSISVLDKTNFFRIEKLSETWREIYKIIHMFSHVVLPSSFDTGLKLGSLPDKTDIGFDLPSIFEHSIVNDVLVGQSADSIIKEIMDEYSTNNFLDIKAACLFMGNMERLVDTLSCKALIDSNIMLPNAPYVPGIRLLTNSEKVNLAIEELKPMLIALSAIGIGLMTPKLISLVRRVLPYATNLTGWVGKWRLKRNAKISRKNSEQVIDDIETVDNKIENTKSILQVGIGDIVDKVTDVSNKIDKNEADRKKLWP